ncbi:melanoma-associated antigen C1-like [Belonocnema kinseyi]|uniref:melanoma-associated antigen C1-like n=1 Tax=Belonocnema kinseyi TaxID=2817044 RepID=UPI00143E0288|nr:melanoma-associated antigen C1-like [Belonocnema kinseyi]
MKTFVLIFLTWGPILVQSTPILESIDEKSELKVIKENLTHSPVLKVNDTKVKESEHKITKLVDSKLEIRENLYKDNLKLKDQEEVKQFKLNDKLILKNNLKFEKASDSTCVDRSKKDCRALTGQNATPTKICFEVTPGIQGGVEECRDGPEFSNRPQIPQEAQPYFQMYQEHQQVPRPFQINYEIPQRYNQVHQQNYEVQLPVSNYGPQQSPFQIPMTWCIQTDAGMQKFDSVIQIDQQSQQGSEYQMQHQHFSNSQNISSSYSQNPSGYPQNPSHQGSEYQIQPQQFTFSQNIPSSYPQNPFTYPQNSRPQVSGYQIQQQPFTFSQNSPSSYPQNPSPQGSEYQIQPQQFTFSQNIPSNFPQNPSGYPENQSGYPKSQNSYPRNPSSNPPNAFRAYPNSPSGYPQNPPNSYHPLISPSYAPQTFPSYPQNFQCAPPKCYCYQNLQPISTQNSLPSFQIPPQQQQESFSPVQPQQQSGFSQNGPHNYPQNTFSDNSQIPVIYPQNQPNKFYPFSDRPVNNLQFEKVQSDNQGYLPFGGNQFGNQASVQSSAQEPSRGHFVQPASPVPTAEGNSQSIQQQTPQNAIYLDARKLQPGPLSRILDKPSSSSQMSGRPGNTENSFESHPRFSGGRSEQAPFRIQL